MRLRLPAVSLALAVACLAIAYVNRERAASFAGIEGAYLDEDVGRGWTAYAPLDDPAPSRFDSFDVWDPYLWLGAGVALALVGLTLLAVGRLRRPSPG